MLNVHAKHARTCVFFGEEELTEIRSHFQMVCTQMLPSAY